MVQIMIEAIDKSDETHRELAKYLKDKFNLILEDDELKMTFKIVKLNDSKELIYTEEDDKIIYEIQQHPLIENVLKDFIFSEFYYD